jgi:acetyl-CoA carboxylase carboxyltransferase component
VTVPLPPDQLLAPVGTAGAGAAAAARRWLERLLDPDSFVASGPGCLGRAAVEGRPITVHVPGLGSPAEVAAALRGAVARTESVVTLHGVGTTGPLADGLLGTYASLGGRIPQLGIVLGPCTGSAAVLAATADLRVCTDEAVLALARADEVRAVTGEQVDLRELGGAVTHARRTGLADLVLDDELGAIGAAKEALAHLRAPAVPADAVEPPPLPWRAEPGRTGDAVASAAAEPRDVRTLLRGVVDGGLLLELQRWFAPNVVTGLARLGGRSVVVVATQPGWRGGALDRDAAAKVARAVALCGSASLGLVVVLDSSGIVPGVAEEHGGALQRYAELARQLGTLRVPRVDLVTGRSDGLAGEVLLTRASATPVLAWPDAPLDRRTVRRIDPSATRTELIAALDAAGEIAGSDIEVPR